MTRLAAAAALAASLATPALITAQGAGRVQVGITGYGQFQFATTSVDEDDVPVPDVPASTFLLRRIRPTVDVTIDGWITGRIQPDFGGANARLADAWMNLAFSDEAQLRLGHFKKPFSRLELISSSRILPIERGVRIAALDAALLVDAIGSSDPPPSILDGAVLIPEHYLLLDEMGHLGRDLGAALHGRLDRFGYEVGVFNGQSSESVDQNDGKSFAARVTTTPRSNLSVGAGTSWRETGPDGDVAGVAFEVDGQWGSFQEEGLHVIGELAFGENLAPGPGGFFSGQAIGAWYMPRSGRVAGIEPLLRLGFANASTERDGDHGWLVTPGINVYLFGRNRLMLNLDLFMPGGDQQDSEYALRAQAQLAF